MKRKAILLSAVLLTVAPAAPAKEPPSDILGIRLGMTETEVRRQLGRIGTLTRGGLKQNWSLKGTRFGYLVVRYAPDGRVLWVTALARPSGARIQYGDVADVRRARRSGSYIYTWSVVAHGGRPGHAVTATGTHSRFLSSLSLSPPTSLSAPRGTSTPP